MKSSQTLILNPFLSTRNFESNSILTNIQTAAPKKGNSLRFCSFLLKKDREYFSKVKDLIFERKEIDSIAFTELEKNHLEEVNVLISPNQTSIYPKYSCPVEVGSTSAEGLESAQKWIVSPEIVFSSMANPPIEVLQKCQNMRVDLAFDTRVETNVWIKDSLTGAWWPYLLSSHLYQIAKKITSNAILVSDLSEEEIKVLSTIHFLVSSGHLERKKKTLEKHISAYKKYKSIHLKDMINPFVREALKNYLKSLENEGFLRFGDFQTNRRFWAHNEVINRFVQAQLCDYISTVVDEAWVPAFTYYVSYQDGSDLKKHIDRSQASLSLSMLIEYGDSSGPKADSWPLFVEKEKGSDTYNEIYIGKGNGVLFEGTDFVHYRLPIPEGHYSMSMLFHFVKAGFSGKLL